MKTTLNCEIYFDRTLVIFVRSAVAAGRPRTQFAKSRFSRISTFRDSKVYARAGSYLLSIYKNTVRHDKRILPDQCNLSYTARSVRGRLKPALAVRTTSSALHDRRVGREGFLAPYHAYKIVVQSDYCYGTLLGEKFYQHPLDPT